MHPQVMHNPASDPANAPEVLDTPDYTRYPEVDERLESPQYAVSAGARAKWDQNNYNHSPIQQQQQHEQQYMAPPAWATSPADGHDSPQALHSQQSWPFESGPAAGGPAGGGPPKESAIVTATEVGQPRRICGMRRRNLFVLAAVALAVVLAIVIGVGAGISTRNNHQDDGPTNANAADSAQSVTSSSPASTSAPTSSTIPSSTSSAPSTLQTVSSVDCNQVQNNSITASSSTASSRYRILCAVHWITGSDAADGNGTVHEVGRSDLVAYTFEQCLGFCDEYNAALNTTVDPSVPGSGCLAVTFNGQYQASINTFNRNCFLKDRQGVWDAGKSTTESGVLIAA